MYEYVGIVESVHDGDTVTVMVDQGLEGFRRLHLRMTGIDAPELAKPAGPPARDHLRALLGPLPAKVVVRTVKDAPDKYGGRWGGNFWLLADGTWGDDNQFVVTAPSLNQRMIADGFAVPYDGGRR
jgi:endonuclease YncB( thermonuclease family)